MQLKNYNRKDLEKEYRRLAKRADQRLVRLEGYRHDKGYEGITSYAYATAMRDIRSWSGADATRFNTKPPVADKDLMKKIADIKKFLEAPTSTKKGVMDIYKKRTESLNKTFFGDDKKAYLTWQEYANFFDKFQADNTDSRFEYNIVIRSGGLIKKHKLTEGDIYKKLNELQRTDKVDVIEAQTIKALNENGLTFERVFK